jgi:hypothetical protein
MNPRTRKAALYAIGAIAILASVNALAHSYAGLYDWAIHHRLSDWQAMPWPAEIDVFLAIGELSLYVAYLDGWPGWQRTWPWATALTGLAVSVAGNIGHISSQPGHPVILADRVTAAISPIAAFAGLAIGLLVLKMTRQHANARASTVPTRPVLVIAGNTATADAVNCPGSAYAATVRLPPTSHTPASTSGPAAEAALLRDAQAICQDAAAGGRRLSQRSLAQQLRNRGHRFPNERLHHIAEDIGLISARAA